MDPTDYEYEYDEEPRQPGRVLWGRVAILGLALALMFVLGRCSPGAGAADDEVEELEERVELLLEENADLSAQLDALRAGGAESSEEQDDEGDVEEAAEEADNAGGDDEEDADEDDGDDRRTHEVAEGDYLYTLAEQYYGDGAGWTLIADANGISRDDPTIRPGMVLEIPPGPDD